MINTVLFDLDNTLVNRDQALRACVHAEFSDPAIALEIIRLDQSGRGDRDELFAYWEQQTGLPIDQAIFGRLLAKYLRPDPDLLHELRALSRRVKLGIVTNGGGGTQREKFRAAGLESVFENDYIWISGEVGMTKPDPGLFLLAVESLESEPTNCLFLGDRMEEDVAGARAAGLRARLVKAPLDAKSLRQLINQEEAR